jgi:tetratricopeptide (TPR) repeat protein
VGDAREVCDSIAESIHVIGCLLQVAYVADNAELGKEQLSKLRSRGPAQPGTYGAPGLLIFARFGQTAIARQWFDLDPRPDPSLKGWLLLTESRFAEASKHLEGIPVNRYGYLLYRFPLAIALERQGKFKEAIARLEEVDLPHTQLCFNAMWPKCRAKLAELYRKVGRIDDAVKVENQLRHYLSEADADFPILAQLRAAEAATRKIARAK